MRVSNSPPLHWCFLLFFSCYNHPSGVKWYFTVVLIFFSLKSNIAFGHLFLYLLEDTTCIFFGEMSIQFHRPFLKRLFCLCVFDCAGSSLLSGLPPVALRGRWSLVVVRRLLRVLASLFSKPGLWSTRASPVTVRGLSSARG